MSRASYNARPSGRSRYRNGKKHNFLVRMLMGLFPNRGDSAFEVIRKVIFIGALGCFIYFGGNVVYDVGKTYIVNIQNIEYMNKIKTLNIPDDIRDEVTKKVPNILPEYILAYSDNNDLVGYIGIPDITLPDDDPEKYSINYLVYQAEDNEYYLDHTKDGSFSETGEVFADYRNKFEENIISANTVLYGHNVYTGTYFAKLSRYHKNTDLSYYKTHPVVQFDTIYEKAYWKVFACVLFNTEPQHGEVYDYINHIEFESKDDFNSFVLDIMDRSVIFTDVDLTYGDHLLTLSTCYYPYDTAFEKYDTRVVVFARKVREGESIEVDTSKAKYNNNFLPFELQKKKLGITWNGRTWDTSYLLSY